MKKLSVIIVYIFYYTALLTNLAYKNITDKNFFKIQFFDVGQGDSILMTTPHKKRVLVDGGANNEVDRYLFTQMPTFCKLDYVILTHPHYDHLAGLNRILKRCKVRKILFNEVYFESSEYAKWLEATSADYSAISETVIAGDIFIVDGVTFYVLWPTQEFLNTKILNVNNASTVLFVDFKTFEVLLLGDAEKKALARIDTSLMLKNIEGKLDVYKAAHHGSNNGIYKPFFEDLVLENVVISVGAKNKYGHPHKGALDLFTLLNATIYRTDLNGTVEFHVL